MQRWEHLTTTDVAGLDRRHAVAVLPVAAVEQHGPHLPLGTDAIIADALIEAAAARLPAADPVLLLPTQRIGHSPEHAGFPGTLDLPPSTLLDAWLGIGRCVAAAGVTKLLILNSHGGQGALVDLAAIHLRVRHAMTVVRFSCYRIAPPPGLLPDDECRFGLHGGLAETSLLLHVAPQLVRRTAVRDFPSLARRWQEQYPALPVEGDTGLGWCAGDLNPEGVTGDAAAATAALGAALLAHWAARLADAIVALQACPPLACPPLPDVAIGSGAAADQGSTSPSAGDSQ